MDDSFYIDATIKLIRYEAVELMQEARRWPKGPELQVLVNTFGVAIHDHAVLLRYFIDAAGKSPAEKDVLAEAAHADFIEKDDE